MHVLHAAIECAERSDKALLELGEYSSPWGFFRERPQGGGEGGGVAPKDRMGLAAAAAAALALVGGGDAARSPGGARAGASPVGVRPPPHPLPLSSPTLHAPEPSREARWDFLG